MLYIVKKGDTLYEISRRFGVSINAILNSNVICNPSLIFPGTPLIIPEPDLDLPTAGGGPYYVVLPGDTLWCLAREFSISVRELAAANQITDPNLIYPGQELLLVPPPDPLELKQSWETTPTEDCLIFEPQRFGIYYLGSFRWEALGQEAIPYLLDLLNNPCDTVRLYAAISLGRIGLNDKVIQALEDLLDDVSFVADFARLAIERIRIVRRKGDRIHLITNDAFIYDRPDLTSPRTALDEGTQVMVLRWRIPSPTGEEGPKGGIQIYDQVQVVATGQIGYLPRAGNAEIILI